MQPDKTYYDQFGYHYCQYCGAYTKQPDEQCWNSPDKTKQRINENVKRQEKSHPVPDKTKEEVLTECTNWPFQSISESPYTCHIKADQALKAMQLYSDQNTAPLLARIRELEGETTVLTGGIMDLSTEIERLRELCKTAYYDASPMMKPQDNINKDFTEWAKKHNLNPFPQPLSETNKK